MCWANVWSYTTGDSSEACKTSELTWKKVGLAVFAQNTVYLDTCFQLAWTGTWTLDPQIKSLMLYRLSYPGSYQRWLTLKRIDNGNGYITFCDKGSDTLMSCGLYCVKAPKLRQGVWILRLKVWRFTDGAGPSRLTLQRIDNGKGYVTNFVIKHQAPESLNRVEAGFPSLDCPAPSKCG